MATYFLDFVATAPRRPGVCGVWFVVHSVEESVGHDQALFVPTALATYASMVDHNFIDDSTFLPSGQLWELPAQVPAPPPFSLYYLVCLLLVLKTVIFLFAFPRMALAFSNNISQSRRGVHVPETSRCHTASNLVNPLCCTQVAILFLSWSKEREEG